MVFFVNLKNNAIRYRVMETFEISPNQKVCKVQIFLLIYYVGYSHETGIKFKVNQIDINFNLPW